MPLPSGAPRDDHPYAPLKVRSNLFRRRRRILEHRFCYAAILVEHRDHGERCPWSSFLEAEHQHDGRRALHGEVPQLLDRDRLVVNGRTSWGCSPPGFPEVALLSLSNCVVPFRNVRSTFLWVLHLLEDPCKRLGERETVLMHARLGDEIAHGHEDADDESGALLLLDDLVPILPTDELMPEEDQVDLVTKSLVNDGVPCRIPVLARLASDSRTQKFAPVMACREEALLKSRLLLAVLVTLQ
mmetsp:Transcript_13866/g.51767  ORF Transcript_13866/g.51767 Transcript_13866/m.51767 type:complete len:242 (-) Transcript_13866:751-1476(-)